MISTTSLAGERELGYCVSCGYGFAGRTRLLADQRELIEALQRAVEVIKQWHNMGGSEDVWQIYYANAPEMKLIRETLTRSTDRRE